jgi:putative oxidoreductase
VAVPLVHGFAGMALGIPLLIIMQTVAAGAAGLLLIGLWTPIAGLLMAFAEMFLAFSHASDPSTHVVLVGLGVALAMIGPGAWSLDARLFGRKRIRIPLP